MPITQYETYKDSGIQWLGEIPAHWEVKRIKDFANVVRGGSPRPAGDSRYYGGSIPFLRVADLTSNEKVYLNTHKYTITEAGLNNTRFVKANTLLLTNSGATLGIPKICTFSTTFNDGVAAFLGLKGINKVFLFYFLKNRTTTFLKEASLGQGQPNLNTEIISQVIISLPPLAEQTDIAQYLDQKTAAIDKKIALLEQKINTYQELRKSLINETVCRGLDKSVPLKDSGIDWIGEIPMHWEIKRGKDIFMEKSRKGYPYEPLLAASQKMGVVLKSLLEQRSMEAQKDFENFKLVKVNDFVISLRSFEGGIEIAYNRGVISPAYSVFSADKLIYTGYYKYLLKSEAFIKNLQTLITGIRDGQTIKFSEIQKTLFPVPPRDEQEKTERYLNEKTQKIDSIIENLKTQIEMLKEFRKTLINDVVTGKIRVAQE